jgi:hypothetical protein
MKRVGSDHSSPGREEAPAWRSSGACKQELIAYQGALDNETKAILRELADRQPERVRRLQSDGEFRSRLLARCCIDDEAGGITDLRENFINIVDAAALTSLDTTVLDAEDLNDLHGSLLASVLLRCPRVTAIHFPINIDSGDDLLTALRETNHLLRCTIAEGGDLEHKGLLSRFVAALRSHHGLKCLDLFAAGDPGFAEALSQTLASISALEELSLQVLHDNDWTPGRCEQLATACQSQPWLASLTLSFYSCDKREENTGSVMPLLERLLAPGSLPRLRTLRVLPEPYRLSPSLLYPLAPRLVEAIQSPANVTLLQIPPNLYRTLQVSLLGAMKKIGALERIELIHEPSIERPEGEIRAVDDPSMQRPLERNRLHTRLARSDLVPRACGTFFAALGIPLPGDIIGLLARSLLGDGTHADLIGCHGMMHSHQVVSNAARAARQEALQDIMVDSIAALPRPTTNAPLLLASAQSQLSALRHYRMLPVEQCTKLDNRLKRLEPG